MEPGNFFERGEKADSYIQMVYCTYVRIILPQLLKGASQCCHEKKVGDVTYVLVDKVDTTSYNCIENWIYEDKENPGSTFCFKTGDQVTSCMRQNGRDLHF